MVTAWAMTFALITLSSAAGQIMLGAGPGVNFTTSVSAPTSSIWTIAIGAAALGGPPVSVKFQYTGVTALNTLQPTPPNFLVVTPANGKTSPTSQPAEVFIGLNESVVRGMAPGSYFLNVNFSTVDQTSPATTHILASLRLSRPGPPAITSVVSAASFQPTLAPGALVSIFGSNFGPPVMATHYDDKGLYPTALPDGGLPDLGNTTVTFGGIAAPLTYVSANQINAIVPYGVAGGKTANVVVTCYAQSTAAFSVPILDTSPAIFTATQNGTGQGAILNVDPMNPYAPSSITYNSATNPAPRGFAVVMYATGTGAWNPAIPDGELALNTVNPMCTVPVPYFPECTQLVNQPLSLTIGGKPPTVFYAGTALYEPWA